MTTGGNDSPGGPVQVLEPSAPSSADGPPYRRGPLALVDGHPLVVVAVLAGLVAAGHALWIWTHRHLGAYDPDEAGYIANALRYQRSLDLLHPLQFVRAVGGTGTGPVVPLLSLPLLLGGVRDPRTVMLVQPVLMVVSAVAVAGIAGRLAGSRSAVAAGLVWATIPTVALATQSYWLGLGAATWCALAFWALLSSDRLRNRWWVAYGLCAALMVMSRTMALGFLPAVAVAGVVVAGRDRRSWAGLVKAGLLAVAVAGPWWVVNWATLSDYLFSYGYGERAALFGQGTWVDRVGFRLGRILDGAHLGQTSDWSTPTQWLVGVALGTAAVDVLRRWRRDGAWPAGTRSGLAVGLAAAAGVAALVSTTNNGVWFELPVVALLVPLTVAALSRAWAPLRVLAVVTAVGFGGWTLGRAWWVVGPGPVQPPRSAHYEEGFAQYDERFAPDRRDELEEAAADWRRVNEELLGELVPAEEQGRRRDPVPVTVTGNMVLVNSNSLALTAELAGVDLRVEIPDTVLDTDRRALSPTTFDGAGNEVERVVVAGLHDKILFTPDAEVADFVEDARAQGWRTVATVPLPDGSGAFEVLRHRSNL